MDGLQLIQINGDLNPEDKKIMIEGMLAYHASKGHIRKTELFSVALKDQAEKLLGCVTVSFLWNGMEISSLWVDESIRKQGWGRKLMEAVEAEGIKRGCTLAFTNTFSWQAPDFYSKIGYTVYGKLENFPIGESLSYFCKKIG